MKRLARILRPIPLVLLAACGPAARPADSPHPIVLGDDLSQQVSGFLEAVDMGLSNLDFASIGSLMTPDVTWFGPRASESLVGRPEVVREGPAAFGPIPEGGTLTARTPFIRVALAPCGDAAWAAEEMDLTLTGGPTPQVGHYRVTSVVFRRGEGWVIAAQAWSVGVPDDVWEAPGGGEWPAPAPLQEAVSPAAESLVDTLENALDGTGLGPRIAPRDDVLVFGPRVSDVAEGAADARRLLTGSSYLAALRLVEGAIRAAVSEDGCTGVVAGLLQGTIEGEPHGAPYRALLVFIHEADTWRLVQAHLSRGLP